jgi:nitrate reductase gamma subunit
LRRVLYSLLSVVTIGLVAGLAGRAGAMRPLFEIFLPYAACCLFVAGLSWRVVQWSLSSVPFRIPTVCGQQRSLGWIKVSRLESPSTTFGVVGRMALEILLFRSLFRNTRTDLRDGPRLIFGEDKYLWLGALAFHWSLLFVVLRHLRLLVEPVPRFVVAIEQVDGFFHVGAPVLYVTDVVIAAALLYLLQRRFREARVRYISLFADYFALFLLLAIAGTGIWMRYFGRVDVTALKQFAVGLATFSPALPSSSSPWFFAHLTLVCALAAYFPFSKLVHMGGVFLSPTRNLANNNRMKRHENPWNYPVKVHTYEEWEAEFHDKIAAAGLPLERP